MDSVGKKTLKEIVKLDKYLEDSNEPQKSKYKKMNIELKNIIETFKWSNQWIRK